VNKMAKRIGALEATLSPPRGHTVFVKTGVPRGTAIAQYERENGSIDENDTVLVFIPHSKGQQCA